MNPICQRCCTRCRPVDDRPRGAAVALWRRRRWLLSIDPVTITWRLRVPGAHGAEQKVARGTGDAVCAAMALVGAAATVLVLYGDTLFITTDTLRRMLDLRAGAEALAVVALGFHAAPPNMYGRMIRGTDGNLERIVEARDAGPTNWRSLFVPDHGDRRRPFPITARLGDNAKGEFYLIDIIALARADGAARAVVEGEEAEFMGIDDRLALRAETVLQDRLRLAAMAAGVTHPKRRGAFLP